MTATLENAVPGGACRDGDNPGQGRRSGDRDRAYLKDGDVAWRGPIHVVHDLPHLVVESLFGITDGL
jgi:hypothetical protein